MDFIAGAVISGVVVISAITIWFFDGLFNSSRCRRENDERREQIESGVIVNKIHRHDND